MLTLQNLPRQSDGLSLLPGCLLRLEGASGSGKTMLLEKIAARRHCPKGHVLFAEQETRGDKEFFADLHYVPEDTSDLTLRWTVTKQLQKWAGREALLVQAALRYFKLESVAEQKINTLSRGWKQRVKLARLIADPALIWLLDHPLHALDEEGKALAEALIAGRCQQNGIVLFTHGGETKLNPHHCWGLQD